MTHLEKDGKEMYALWQALTEGEKDPIRSLLQILLQGVLEGEIETFLNAGPYERTGERKGYRNGYKPRTFKTRVGTLDLQIPKDREGNFQTSVFEKYQRSEKAFVLSIAEMFVQGVSTRKVKKITETLCGIEISKSQVSQLSKNLDEEIAKWRSRPITKKYPYLMIDARYEHIRKDKEVVSQGVLLVIGIREDGYREILGTWVADTENEASWSDVFKELKDRGLRGVRYVVSDDHAGLVKAIKRQFQGVLWQRCQVHFMRNILSRIRKNDREEMVELVRKITTSKTLEEAKENTKEVVEILEKRYPAVARHLEEHVEEILNVYHLPECHRRRMRSTNMIERYHQELKRRTRVIRIFPNEASCLRLVSALSMETNEEWMERRYLTFSEEDDEVIPKVIAL